MTTEPNNLVVECSLWLFERRSPALRGATLTEFVDDPLVKAAIQRMAAERVRKAIARDKASSIGWADETALRFAEDHEAYVRRRADDASQFEQQAMADEATCLVDRAVNETLAIVGPEVGTRLQALQARLSSMADFQIELRDGVEALSETATWTATFLRDARRQTTRIEVRSPGHVGVDATIQRGHDDLIKTVVFAPAATS